ncbi:unnamed protein product [Urochloa humidicola]
MRRPARSRKDGSLEQLAATGRGGRRGRGGAARGRRSGRTSGGQFTQAPPGTRSLGAPSGEAGRRRCAASRSCCSSADASSASRSCSSAPLFCCRRTARPCGAPAPRPRPARAWQPPNRIPSARSTISSSAAPLDGRRKEWPELTCARTTCTSHISRIALPTPSPQPAGLHARRSCLACVTAACRLHLLHALVLGEREQKGLCFCLCYLMGRRSIWKRKRALRESRFLH